MENESIPTPESAVSKPESPKEEAAKVFTPEQAGRLEKVQQQAIPKNISKQKNILQSIMKKYEGEAIIVETIRLYIEDETSFTTYQMKGALKFLEMKGTIRIEPIKFNGKVRRKNTFADDVEIRFPPF